METVTFLRFSRAAYLRRGPTTRFADQGPLKTVSFLRIPSKIFMSGTRNFRIIDRNIKAIFREYFSSLHEDSGNIFKLMTFTRGPRTTYCIKLLIDYFHIIELWPEFQPLLFPNDLTLKNSSPCKHLIRGI